MGVDGRNRNLRKRLATVADLRRGGGKQPFAGTLIVITRFRLMTDNRIVAIGLLTQRDLEVLGTGFSRAFPVQDMSDFDDLLSKLDRIDAVPPRREQRPHR